MAVSYNDKYILSTDVNFQNRVRQSMLAASIAIASESSTGVAFHRERATFATAIMNAPDTYKVLFSNSVANDTNVINDATASGTVTLTAGNLATQSPLVTDAHIDTAISSQFNAFFRTPAN